MAKKTPVSLLAVDLSGMLNRNIRLLIERDGAITPEERELSKQFHELRKLIWKTDYSRRLATAELEGYGDTPHQGRCEREHAQGLERLDCDYEEWVSSLSPAKTRLIVPLGRYYQGYGESA